MTDKRITELLLTAIIVLFSADVFAMSAPIEEVAQTPQKPAAKSPDSNEAQLIKSAIQQICEGNFSDAEQILNQLDGNNPEVSALSNIISEYRQIQLVSRQSQEQLLNEQLKKLEQYRLTYDSNDIVQIDSAPEQVKQIEESNLLEVLPIITKAWELADANQKQQILADSFVQKILNQSRQKAAQLESQGKWLDALIYCYSWLEVFYEEDKQIASKKKELEEKTIILSSLLDNPCETVIERYQKVRPQMFIRSLEVLEYGYIEPFQYNDMADRVFSRLRNLMDVLRFAGKEDSNAVSAENGSSEQLMEITPNSKIKVVFAEDKLTDFLYGLEDLKKKYTAQIIVLTRDQFIKLFNEIRLLNSETAKLPDGIIVYHFADAALSALDPHTTIVWPKEREDFEKNMTNEFEGIGVEISKADGFLRAASLVPGTPAYYSGIDAGDIIEAIDGEPTRDMPINCAVSKITGPAGTKVKLTIRRESEDRTFDVEITRAKIVVPTTRGWSRDKSGKWLYFIDPDYRIGYVRITNFSATTASDLDSILTELENESMKALILDLRFNTGGYLQSAAEVIDIFVDKGVVVSMQPRVGLPTWETAHKKGTHPDYPLVILINSSSASASEIVAGALADKKYQRAVLVGQQSYGKGSVQTITNYPGDGAQLKYTMAYYHLPSGEKVKDRHAMEKLGRKDWGIIPNVKVELTSDEIKKIIDIQKDNDVLASAIHDESKSKLVRHSLRETIQTDRQLAVAILIAKAKLIETGLVQ